MAAAAAATAAAAAAAAAVSSPNSFLVLKKNPNPIQTTSNFTPKPKISTSISCTATHTPTTHTPAAASAYRRHVFNFAAGPATLPESVLLKAQAELFDFQSSGMSIMEMSHRGKEFDSVIKKAESDLRLLLSIPDDYSVLFLQGGATTQFAAIPLNLCPSPETPTDFIVTGSWGDKAYKEAAKYSKPNLIWSGKSNKYTTIPSFDEIPQTPGARFLHICANATRKENPPAWMATPQFGGWDQKKGDAPNYSMVFSRARANRKEHKSDPKHASFGNERELIMPAYNHQHYELTQKKRRTLFRYFSCCYVPESEFEKISRV